MSQINGDSTQNFCTTLKLVHLRILFDWSISNRIELCKNNSIILLLHISFKCILNSIIVLNYTNYTIILDNTFKHSKNK